MNATRRERLDAILDAGLVHAPEEEQAWLAIEREADASFDAEVRELLALTDEVLAWGIRAAESGSASSPLDGALAAIFEGIDAGLYDDELRLDDAAGLADGLAGDPGDAEGMAPAATGVLRSGERLRAPRPVAPVAEAPAARATSSATRAESSAGAGRVVRLLRDNRLAQVLAAAAAVLVVVSAGFSAVSVVNRQPDASAIQGAPMAAAPAPTVAPMPTAAPAAAAFEAPSAEAEPEAAPLEPPAPTEALAGETLDAVPAPAPPSAPVAQLSDDGVAGGLSLRAEAQTAGTLREVDDSDTGRTTARSADRSRMATASSTSVSPASMSASGSAARPQGSVRYVDDFFASSPDGPQREIVAESAGEGASASRGAPAPGAAAPSPAPPAARYRTWSALRPVLTACLGPGRDATVEIARTSGLVRVLAAPSATATELRCLRGAAAESAISPAPTVTRQLRVSRAAAAVSDTSAQ